MPRDGQFGIGGGHGGVEHRGEEGLRRRIGHGASSLGGSANAAAIHARDACRSPRPRSPWSSRSRQARDGDHADRAGAVHGDRKAAAGQHIVGAVEAVARLEGAVGTLLLQHHAVGALQEHLHDIALAPRPIGIVGGRARHRGIKQRPVEGPDVDDDRQLRLAARARGSPSRSRRRCLVECRKHQAPLAWRFFGDVVADVHCRTPRPSSAAVSQAGSALLAGRPAT